MSIDRANISTILAAYASAVAQSTPDEIAATLALYSRMIGMLCDDDESLAQLHAADVLARSPQLRVASQLVSRFTSAVRGTN